eukprot:CAMPEP_0176357992 /NCGR_PEP_ID=MMETSP0126-20121128/15203_1 /TAXON_ID=141414 ORGANISM="Strombidinopsis acuminatum, Strain SPMC142" /NCGR_SAMPLE_ID=MMETSP0126 /ASSEMBLY_ACC=CAM_ASM_000229 /LENGTH=92 /DNA_ID=CAMNT_0017711905 /DNA_START=352 /DNA_END=630 /DNA_ORIENTATION=+
MGRKTYEAMMKNKVGATPYAIGTMGIPSSDPVFANMLTLIMVCLLFGFVYWVFNSIYKKSDKKFFKQFKQPLSNNNAERDNGGNNVDDEENL